MTPYSSDTSVTDAFSVSSGTGKTHVALGLGLAACQKDLAVGFAIAPGRLGSMS